MNKPPCYIEGDCNWKENDTAKKLAVRYHQFNNTETKDLAIKKKKNKGPCESEKDKATTGPNIMQQILDMYNQRGVYRTRKNILRSKYSLLNHH